MLTPRTVRRLSLAAHQRWMFTGRLGDPPAMRCTPDEAARIRRRLHRAPKPLERPVAVIAGYLDPGVYAWVVARELRRLTSHRRADFFVPRFRLDTAIEPMAARVAEQLRARAGGGPASFDLVGLSMGGLVARCVARACAHDEHLSIARVFTLGTPHRGSTLAERIAPSEAARQMRPGSGFLRDLDAGPGDLDLTCYQMDADAVIGHGHGSPPGHPAVRLPRRAGEPHLHVMADPLAILDVALRLRDEPAILSPQEGFSPATPISPKPSPAGPEQASIY